MHALSSSLNHVAPLHAASLHFRLWLLRSALTLVESALGIAGSLDEVLARYPVVRHYVDDAAQAGLDGLTLGEAIARLDDRLVQFAGAAGEQLPLERLRAAVGLDTAGVNGFLVCGLVDEDPRFGALVDELMGHDGRPTRATLVRGVDGEAAAAAVPALLAGGFLREQDVGRWRLLGVPPPLWDAVQGALPPAVDWRVTEPQGLSPLSDLILPETLLSTIAALRRVARPESLCWALRGAPGSGRRALAGALARAEGRGLLEPASPQADVGTAGALATVLGLMPLFTVRPAPGERLTFPALPLSSGAVAVRLPRHGGLDVEGRVCRWLELDMPSPEERRRHWSHALKHGVVTDGLVSLRVPRGTLHRVARGVPQGAADPMAVVMTDIEERGRFALDGVAHRLSPPFPGEPLLCIDGAREDFETLVARCRHREALGAVLPAAFGHESAAGVRALFKGPSGTGKTLAARHLAAAIGRPLYRVDLAATVSKYIGETERNLERVFEAAEALDIVLLIDEGDALMAGRTGVSSATDRYANLETNYLLQRLEAYAGILVVTTNAPERIDGAFTRRMDATLEFPLPDADTRFDLWLAHLPHDHVVSGPRLDEVALRCALSGGQIRNAALHGTLLALERRAPLGDDELLLALQREYRKAGHSCPSLSMGC